MGFNITSYTHGLAPLYRNRVASLQRLVIKQKVNANNQPAH